MLNQTSHDNHIDKEVYLGVIQLIRNIFATDPAGTSTNSPSEIGSTNFDPRPSIVFEGQNRLQAKRAMLQYWSRNKSHLGLDFEQYRSRCRLKSDKRTIEFR